MSNQPTSFEDVNREVVAKLLPRVLKIGMLATDADEIISTLEDCFRAGMSARDAEVKALIDADNCELSARDSEIKALREALEAARTYLEERHIREKGVVGRTKILPMIDAALGGKEPK